MFGVCRLLLRRSTWLKYCYAALLSLVAMLQRLRHALLLLAIKERCRYGMYVTATTKQLMGQSFHTISTNFWQTRSRNPRNLVHMLGMLNV